MHVNDILLRSDLQYIKARFDAKRDRRGPDECWNWTAATMAHGYGKLGVDGDLFGAHVLAYLFEYGPIPNFGRGVGKNLCRHTCDNTACTNPKHIILGLQNDNLKDAWDRKRVPLGMARKHTKVPDEIVLAIRADPRLHREIAEEYGMQRRYVSRIKQGVRRQHV